MFGSRNRKNQQSEGTPKSNGVGVRRWIATAVMLLTGGGLLVASPTGGEYRVIELLGGVVFVGASLVNATIDLLLTFAAKTVRPRKLVND